VAAISGVDSKTVLDSFKMIEADMYCQERGQPPRQVRNFKYPGARLRPGKRLPLEENALYRGYVRHPNALDAAEAEFEHLVGVAISEADKLSHGVAKIVVASELAFPVGPDSTPRAEFLGKI